MKKGDILLIKYKWCPVGWLIRRVTHSKWNHVALAIDHHYLIESKGSGVVISSIKKYLNPKLYKVKLIRLKGLKKKEIKQFVVYAKQQLGKHNYFIYIWTLLKIIFGYVGHVRLMTCSGMIAYCLSQVGVYFKKNKNPLLITPANINQSKNTINITAKELFK